VINDNGEDQRLIRTLLRKGVRFVGDVREQASSPHAVTAAQQPKSPPLVPDRPSIAVFPFTNLSDEKEQEYFADGMVEDITTALSHAPKIGCRTPESESRANVSRAGSRNKSRVWAVERALTETTTAFIARAPDVGTRAFRSLVVLTSAFVLIK